MLALLLQLALTSSPLDARVEVQLIPFTAQANTLDSGHLGSGGRLTVRLNRYLGGYFGGVGHWHISPSEPLSYFDRFKVDLFRATPVLSTWQLMLGLESIPLSGSFRVASMDGGEFGLVVRAGLGITGSRIRLKPPTVKQDGSPSPATWGDAGVRLAGEFGLAFRFNLGSFAVHLGPRLSMWSNELSRVNGCNLDDLRAMDLQIRAGLSPAEATVSSACQGFPSSNDIPLAMLEMRSLVRDGLVINVAAELGVSWSF